MNTIEILTQCVWKGSVLMGAAFAANMLLRKRSAALRHSIWTACFAALLILPAAVRSLPEWHLFTRVQMEQVQLAAPATMMVSTVAAPAAQPSPVPWLLLLWIAGAAAVALWFLTGIARAAWMVRRGTTVDGAPDLAPALGIRRRVRILASDAVPMPMTWGILRPVVIVPRASSGWTEARWRAVLLHEFLHVRRLDLLAQGIGQAACCLFWFHPFAWIAARQFRELREHACDDAVLAQGVSAPEYATHLMDLVRAMAARRNSWSQAPAMAEASGLESRVRAMLDAKRDRRPLTFGRHLAIVAAGAALLLPLAALTDTTRISFIPAPQIAVPPEAAQAVAPAVPAPARHTAPHRKLLAVAAEPVPPAPQIPRGSLAGTVRDPSGAVVPNGTVTLRNLDGFNSESAKTDSAGKYEFNAIAAGRYSLSIQAPGFAIFALHQVELKPNNVARVDANLEIGAVSESVTVQGKRSTAAPPAPTPDTSVPQRIKVGGSVQMAQLVRQPRPVYPAELQQAGIEGTVRIKSIISKQGIPINSKVISNTGDPRLVQLALDAVAQWRYQPALLNGEPVETLNTVDVTFQLDQ